MPTGEGLMMADRSLGDELRNVRELAGMTLREVEEACGVSNAYLSQLETGKITRPSPQILHKLSTVYAIPYDMMMEKAGYIMRSEQDASQHSPGNSLAGAALATLSNLTAEEYDAIAAFLVFLRKQKHSRG